MESRQWVLEAIDPRTDLKQRFVYNVDQIREEEDSTQQKGACTSAGRTPGI